jgi:tetratricopeptide (TPR) repeat protein/SAM-dependent methyltransferase
MNRKDRRKAAKANPDVQALLAEAAQAHRAGQLDQAERGYRGILRHEPRHADSLHRLGLIAYQRGDHASAEKTIRQAIAQNPGHAAYHSHLAMALAAAGKTEDALRSCRQAMTLDPTLPDAPNTWGLLLLAKGAFEDAAAAFAKSIALGGGWPEAHSNLGDALLALGRVQEAQDAYGQALTLAPDLAAAHAGLASLSRAAGRLEEAIAFYRRALQIEPDNSGMQRELALALHAAGDRVAALEMVQHALRADDSFDNRKAFIACVKDLRLAEGGHVLRPLLLRALEENWSRPEDLAPVVADLARLDLGDTDAIADAELLSRLGRDRLLSVLLRLTPNQDPALECILTRARRILLRQVPAEEALGEGLASFRAALAQQCFLNEYVFACEEDERREVENLRGRLSVAGAAPDVSLLLTVASYVPLYTLPDAMALAKMPWPDAAVAVVAQQIVEPLEEQCIKPVIPRLTEIRDAVSRSVATQYSENPYPRWAQADAAGAPQSLPAFMHRQFPLARFPVFRQEGPVEILVAGCGTGRNAIEVRQRFDAANMLAIDLSLPSLAHAARKSREKGLDIVYAQADLLDLSLPDRQFDLIEAVGVLHHLADPFEGWRRLLSFLKPGGFMYLGFYSRMARQDVIAARSFLSAHELGVENMSKARRALMEAEEYSTLMDRPDFYTTSTCRDLLFHVQEHQLDLGDIAGFLHTHGLRFLGFWTDPDVMAAYQQRFPDDPAAVHLDHWRTFEAGNPRAFSGMYQLWVQKAGPGAA